MSCQRRRLLVISTPRLHPRLPNVTNQRARDQGVVLANIEKSSSFLQDKDAICISDKGTRQVARGAVISVTQDSLGFAAVTGGQLTDAQDPNGPRECGNAVGSHQPRRIVMELGSIMQIPIFHGALEVTQLTLYLKKLKLPAHAHSIWNILFLYRPEVCTRRAYKIPMYQRDIVLGTAMLFKHNFSINRYIFIV